MDVNDEIVYKETFIRLTFLAYVAGAIGGLISLLPSLLNSMAILIICSSALSLSYIRIKKKDTLSQSTTVKYDSISMFLTIIILTNLIVSLIIMYKS
nr:MAG TPA: hypothetical protein [Caudoviricetes sp.]